MNPILQTALPGHPETNSPLPLVLLVEPDHMLRRTVALTARSLQMAEIHECSGFEEAERLINQGRFDGLLLSLADGSENDQGKALLRRIRAGLTKSAAGLPIAVVLEHIDRARVERLRELQVVHVVVRPLKARTLLQALAALAAHAAQLPITAEAAAEPVAAEH